MKKLATLSATLFLLFSFSADATHNRAGEITYKRVPPFSKVQNNVTIPAFNYSITVTKYHNYGSGVATRCVDTVNFGDGTSGVAPRINGVTCPDCGTLSTCGDVLSLGNNKSVLVSIYAIVHEYDQTGQFKVTSSDPNRNQDIVNIPGSVNQPFTIEALLIVNSTSGVNQSPVINTLPIADATLNACYFHFPAATDTDGDSLSYEITQCLGSNGQAITSYSFPDPGQGGTFAINQSTGQLTWCHPQQTGTYAVAYKVKEWRKNTSGIFQQIGYVLRDMEITVIFAPVSIDENAADGISIYPNPANDELRVNFNAKPGPFSCSIVSPTGQQVGFQQFTKECGNMNVDISDLKPGVYYITFKVSSGFLTKKFVCQ
jgi:hypothetical protein